MVVSAHRSGVGNLTGVLRLVVVGDDRAIAAFKDDEFGLGGESERHDVFVRLRLGVADLDRVANADRLDVGRCLPVVSGPSFGDGVAEDTETEFVTVCVFCTANLNLIASVGVEQFGDDSHRVSRTVGRFDAFGVFGEFVKQFAAKGLHRVERVVLLRKVGVCEFVDWVVVVVGPSVADGHSRPTLRDFNDLLVVAVVAGESDGGGLIGVTAIERLGEFPRHTAREFGRRHVESVGESGSVSLDLAEFLGGDERLRVDFLVGAWVGFAGLVQHLGLVFFLAGGVADGLPDRTAFGVLLESDVRRVNIIEFGVQASCAFLLLKRLAETPTASVVLRRVGLRGDTGVHTARDSVWAKLAGHEVAVLLDLAGHRGVGREWLAVAGVAALATGGLECVGCCVCDCCRAVVGFCVHYSSTNVGTTYKYAG